jgi:hypothetical protein
MYHEIHLNEENIKTKFAYSIYAALQRVNEMQKGFRTLASGLVIVVLPIPINARYTRRPATCISRT